VIEDTFRFRHILIRDAAYERIPKELRSELHERYADWLDGRGEQFDEIVGYHLEQSFRSVADLGPLGDRARALASRAAERLTASGRRANIRGDVRAAANLFDRAVSLLPVDDRRRLLLLPWLGRALRETGEMDRAATVLSQAIERAQAAGERAVAADALVALSDIRFHRATMARDELVRELDNAIAVFEELGDDAGLARALGLSGKLRLWRGEAAVAIEELERAAKYARGVGDWAQHADSLHYVMVATYYGPTPVVEALQRVEEIRSRAEGSGRLEVTHLLFRARLEAMRAHFDAARDLISHARGIAEEHGLEVLLASHVGTSAGEAELAAGDAAAAERALRPECEQLERIGELGYLASAAPQLAEALFAQGRDDEALQVTERWPPERLTVPEDADAQVAWRRVRAKLLARRGDFEEAERLAREATEIAARTDHTDMRAQALADLAEVLRIAGRPEESAASTQEALRLYEQKGNVTAAARLSGSPAPAPPTS
jgi:tetratricopeptide (TPR) repeat protein